MFKDIVLMPALWVITFVGSTCAMLAALMANNPTMNTMSRVAAREIRAAYEPHADEIAELEEGLKECRMEPGMTPEKRLIRCEEIRMEIDYLKRKSNRR